MIFRSNNNLLSIILFLFLFSACGTDEDSPPVEDATTESFTDLTIEQISQLETPFEALTELVQPGGRVKSHEISIEKVIEVLEELFPGSFVVESEEDEERGLTVVKFQIQLNEDAFIEFSLVVELGRILEIEGQLGPFDYDIEPGGNFVGLQQAIQAALSEISGGEIERWELELEEDNKWEFEIHIVNDEGRWEIEIDAFSGRIIKIKFKSKRLDEEEDFDRPGDEAPAEIIELALSIVPGEVVHARKKERHDESFWFIAIITPVNSLVKVAFTTSGELREIKGSEKPFDYVVEPGNDLVSFAAAKEILAEEIDGELLEWKLRQRERGDLLIWVYHFHVAKGDQLFEVRINALTGTIIEFDEEHEDDGIRHLPESVREIVAGFIDAEIVHVEIDTEHDRRAWKITVITSSGAEVEITVEEESGELVEIRGEIGPFDYDVTPEGLINFSEILAIVLDTGDEELIAWELEFNADFKWVYQLIIVAGDNKIRIRIDAETGEIIGEEFDELDHRDLIPGELLDLARHLIRGEVVAVFREEADRIIWIVKLETDNGARVFIGFTEEGHIANIEDLEGPFDYNVEPGMGLISFNAAKEIALDTGDEVLTGWELERNDQDEWFYKLFIRVGNDEITVRINAVTGDIV